MTAAAMTRLEVTAASLAGTTLIEANAGTGKTWTITALYVRLLLEAGCKVDQILVVTFTEVATAELRDRIRKRLVETRAALERGTASEGDALVAALLARFPDRTQVLHDLEDALANFDQAPIYTIHGFCQRALGDWAFETAMPFKTELVPDPSEILQEIVEDFWRNELHGASPLFTGYLVQQKVDPGCLQKDVRSWIGKPHLVFRGPDEAKDIAALETRYSEAWREAQAIWLRARNEVQKQLVTSTGLHAGKYKRASIPQWIEEMDACLAPRNPGVLLCHQFEKFTPEALERATNRGGRTPRHAFYDACGALKATHDALMPAYAARLARMKMRLVEYCNAELATRKKARQLQSFDDLLLNLHDALHDHRAPKLVEALRVRYSAALIDEFQDTDPVQYEIFKRIYADSGRPVFLVGDPKQSIYSFRGADVFAYLNARRDAQNSHTLDRNWRSAPGLLEAVNLIFSTAPTPFVFEDIPFHRSYPAQGDRGRFVIEGEQGAPLELWYLQSEDGKPITKGAACDMGARATAAEIARLMNLGERKQARIVERKDGIVRERRLRGGDVAVLVRSHRQGKIVRDALAACGVSSVQRGSENVFSSVEAEELERVLLAIAEPGRETRVSAALTTEIMGYSGERLHAAQADEGQWEPLVESFREAQRDWHEHGFIRMLRAFFKRHGVVCRLLEYGDGERRVTNLLHLSERLHCEADTHGASGLIAWLAAKRRAAGSENEEELLRLESDENLVKILTVHVAKGLEFPLVFCPFLWDLGSRSAKKDVITFHDADDGFGQVIDFGSDELEVSRAQATREELAENLRLMYVALTRAKYRCWMAWGPVADAHTSAPAWLLHRQQLSLSPSSGDGGGEGKQKHALSPSRGEGGGEGKLEPGRMLAELQELAASSAGTIRVTPLEPPAPVTFTPAETSDAPFVARTFTGALRDTRRVTSFTGLAHGRAIEAPDYDAADRYTEPDTPISGRDIFAFPRGAHAGKCLHAIFEHVDFANLTRAELERIVTRDLTFHGFDTQWTRAVSDMVQSVAATPLDEAGTLRLQSVSRSQRLDELEFYYPIRDLSDRHLREILLAWGFSDEVRQRIGELTFSTAQGYMRGFIDLVFEHGGRYYLADYKSNWLGASVSGYGQPQLAKAMAREAYYLQYLIYCVALHRYLGARLSGYSYENHFGGVRYLFVRGMRPDLGASSGVYSDRPSEGLILALDGYLRTGRPAIRLEKPVQGVLDL